MNKQYILFDLDGTVTDSAEGIINCVKYALTLFPGVELSMETLRKFIGPPLVDAFMGFAGLTRENALKAVEKYRERYRDTGIFENLVYDDIEQALQSLQSAGKTLVLATSKPKIFADKILEHFGLTNYFSLVVGAELNGKLNYKHEVIMEVFRLLKLNAEQQKLAVMVGDRKQDIDGAKHCGITSIGVKYGFAEENELENAGADYIVQTPLEIVKLILQG